MNTKRRLSSSGYDEPSLCPSIVARSAQEWQRELVIAVACKLLPAAGSTGRWKEVQQRKPLCEKGFKLLYLLPMQLQHAHEMRIQLGIKNLQNGLLNRLD